VVKWLRLSPVLLVSIFLGIYTDACRCAKGVGFSININRLKEIISERYARWTGDIK